MPSPLAHPAQPVQPGGDETSPAAPTAADAHRPRRRRARRVAKIVALSLLAALVVAVGAFLVWANDTYAAEPDGIAAVRDDPRVRLDDQGDAVVMTPTGASDGRGLVFLAGAKVEPQAYAATFHELAAEGTTVVVVEPFLHLAILERRPFEAFTALAADVEVWAVGGHSMGGVRACTYAESEEVDALVLLASYCSLGDLSGRADLAALSVSGTQDALVSQETIDESLPLMPEDTELVRIEGASHAQFGDYGPQSGDGTPTITDDEARARITEALVPFLTSAGR
ncbi:alpha/beta hydrolase [Oerskovia flava]|uniref:alpha/beta hydrolase n=1 Tax=Oerskovia flava TaxID=2986422 RepID=UPI00223EE6B2|nr:alpha/beta hydrolase [Oerskovia sp. JB1-3-2]